MSKHIYSSDKDSNEPKEYIKIVVWKDNYGKIKLLETMSINDGPKMLAPDDRYSGIYIIHNEDKIKLPAGGMYNKNKNIYKRYYLNENTNYIFIFESKDNYNTAKVYKYSDGLNIDKAPLVTTIRNEDEDEDEDEDEI